MENVRTETKRLALCAVMLAIGLLLKSVTIKVAAGGVTLMDIWFGGPFINILGVLFGPAYGAITGALGDIIGYFLKGDGVYMFPFTITAALKSLSIGLLWKLLKNVNPKHFSLAYYISFGCLLAFGLFNLVISSFFKDGGYYLFLQGISSSEKSFNKLMQFLSVALIALGVFGLIAAAIQPYIKKLTNAGMETYLKIFIVICIPSLVFTTVNTGVLMFYYESLRSQGFLLLWIPRVIEESIMIVYNSLMIMLFFRLIKRQSGWLK